MFKGYVSDNFNDGSFFRVTSNIGPKMVGHVWCQTIYFGDQQSWDLEIQGAVSRYLHDRRNRQFATRNQDSIDHAKDNVYNVSGKNLHRSLGLAKLFLAAWLCLAWTSIWAWPLIGNMILNYLRGQLDALYLWFMLGAMFITSNVGTIQISVRFIISIARVHCYMHVRNICISSLSCSCW